MNVRKRGKEEILREEWKKMIAKKIGLASDGLFLSIVILPSKMAKDSL